MPPLRAEKVEEGPDAAKATHLAPSTTRPEFHAQRSYSLVRLGMPQCSERHLLVGIFL